MCTFNPAMGASSLAMFGLQNISWEVLSPQNQLLLLVFFYVTKEFDYFCYIYIVLQFLKFTYGYCEVTENMDKGNGSPEFYSHIWFQFPLSQYYEKFANIR